MYMKRGDWLPSKKKDQLQMVRNWVLSLETKHEAWNVPTSKITSLIEAYAAAEHENSIPSSERNMVTNMRKKTAFSVLTEEMRDIKRRYFYIPPLTESDFKGLGLKPKDTTPTPIGDPVGLVTATIRYPNEGALELRFEHVMSSPFDRRANYGIKIRYGIFHVDAPPVVDVNLLVNFKFTKRRKEMFNFDRENRKKIAYFCMRYENSKGGEGQWGPVISGVIP